MSCICAIHTGSCLILRFCICLFLFSAIEKHIRPAGKDFVEKSLKGGPTEVPRQQVSNKVRIKCPVVNHCW